MKEGDRMAVKALKIAGFIAASIVFFNLYVLFDKTFITHTAFTFEFVKNILQPAILSACLAAVFSFMKKPKSSDEKQVYEKMEKGDCPR